MDIKIYGCRGSISMMRGLNSRYGANTSCFLLRVPGQDIIFDAGSGLLRMECELKEKHPDYPHGAVNRADIIISHLHLDHIIGLTAFAPLYADGDKARIYTCSRAEDSGLKHQIFGLFAPPYWPVPLENTVKSKFVEIFDGVPFSIGSVVVTPFHAQHPDITLSYHIEYKGKRIVHLLDNELVLMDKESYAALVEYCRDADLVISDAAYTTSDYLKKAGWGHSTIDQGLKLAEESGCKIMLFSHFSPNYTDEELDSWPAQFKPNIHGTRFLMAHDGLELVI